MKAKSAEVLVHLYLHTLLLFVLEPADGTLEAVCPNPAVSSLLHEIWTWMQRGHRYCFSSAYTNSFKHFAHGIQYERRNVKRGLDSWTRGLRTHGLSLWACALARSNAHWRPQQHVVPRAISSSPLLCVLRYSSAGLLSSLYRCPSLLVHSLASGVAGWWRATLSVRWSILRWAPTRTRIQWYCCLIHLCYRLKPGTTWHVL